MSGPFHGGELEIQRRAGSSDLARAVGAGIGDRLSEAAARFLARQRLVIAASLGRDGRVWASPLTGAPGFVQAIEPRLVRLVAQPLAGDPLGASLAARPELGLLVIDLATRQRLRLNGRAVRVDEGIFLAVEQAYGNCPKYIQRRLPAADAPPTSPPPTRVTDRLDRRQRERIASADTLFVASAHPEGGADASHRGGFPGFVRVAGARRLSFDHYSGNGMFNTLGNLAAAPRAGLLFLDFTNGDVLQLTGEARIAESLALTFAVETVRDTPGASPLRLVFGEYSPANPPLHPNQPRRSPR